MFLFVVLFGGAATHTINLHLDLTQLDLTESKPYCTRSDLVKYRHLGLTVEEIVEVAMKLSSLKNLGISLTIEGIYLVLSRPARVNRILLWLVPVCVNIATKILSEKQI